MILRPAWRLATVLSVTGLPLSVYWTLTLAEPALADSTSTSASAWATSELTSRWRMAKSAIRTLSHASSCTGRQIPLVTNRGPQSQPYS